MNWKKLDELAQPSAIFEARLRNCPKCRQMTTNHNLRFCSPAQRASLGTAWWESDGNWTSTSEAAETKCGLRREHFLWACGRCGFRRVLSVPMNDGSTSN